MRLIILGAGGYGRTVADAARQSGIYDEICFLDDSGSGLDLCTNFALYMNDDTAFYPAFGNNELRLTWLHRLMRQGCSIPTIIHPTAYVSPTAQVLPGTAVMPHAVVNTECLVKTGCIVNCSAIIDHGCILEEGVHVCLGAIVKAENRIPRCVKIEAGEVVANRTYPV